MHYAQEQQEISGALLVLEATTLRARGLENARLKASQLTAL